MAGTARGVVLDAEARATWIHRGRFVGDYPPLSEVLEQLEAARRSSWLEPEAADSVSQGRPSVVFQDYDWELGCTVRPRADSETTTQTRNQDEDRTGREGHE